MDKRGEQPLRGKSVLLVCSPLKAGDLAGGLESLGAQAQIFEAISVRPVETSAALDAALASLENYNWIIFTSAYAVLFFARRMAELGLPVKQLGRIQTCAIGPGTAAKAAEAGIRISLVPEEFVAEGVLKALGQRLGGLENLKGQRILIPRAREAREILPAELSAAGALVDVAVCYETVQAEADSELVARIVDRPPDLIVFTSSSNVVHFTTIVGASEGRRLLDEAKVAVLGPVTAKTVESFGKTPEIVPPQNTIPSLVESIRLYFHHQDTKTQRRKS